MTDLKYKPTAKIEPDKESAERIARMDEARKKAKAYLEGRGISLRLKGGIDYKSGADCDARFTAEEKRIRAEQKGQGAKPKASNVRELIAKETK